MAGRAAQEFVDRSVDRSSLNIQSRHHRDLNRQGLAWMPDPEALVQRYAERSGREVGPLSFALALGYFKVAVIAEGIHARFLAGHTVGSGFDRVGEAVSLLAAAGLAAYVRDPP